MANTLISPGVLSIENDQSFITQQPVTVGAAIIGPTVKGPVEVPTICTSYTDYQNKFGTTFVSGSQQYSYFTSIAAYNYFLNGGETLLVARVVSGSFTSANSTPITNGELATTASATLGITPFSASFAAEGSSSFSVNGIAFNFTGGAFADTATQINIDASGFTTPTTFASGSVVIFNASSSATAYTSSLQYITASNSTATLNLFTTASQIGTVFSADVLNAYTVVSESVTTNFSGATNEEALVLKTISEGTIMNSSSSLDASGSLASGSEDNIRFQIANSDTAAGTFSLIIRQGNDNTNEQIVLETWTNLSMDPTAPNYVARVIGDQVKVYSSLDGPQINVTGDYPNASRYVYVSSVATPTPLYFDNNGIAKSQFTGSIPTNKNGSFTGATGDLFGAGATFFNNNITTAATNTQGLPSSSYDDMISLLANQDDYRFNVLITPGLFANQANLGASQVTTIINNTMNRGDNIYITDLVPFGSSVSLATSTANSKNTSYAASYWPWVQVVDPNTAQLVWVPASTLVAGVYAYNDNVSEPWFAPAGINRGGLSTVVRAERKLTQAQRDTLYINKVNPIATFPGTGVVVYGQKTLQTRASALDRVNVRRLLISLKSYIGQVANNLVFEQNTIATRNAFLAQVNPFMESVQQRQGLYAFKVIMDSSNNTPDVIDRNQLVGQIYLQPTKTAEFIYLNFNILPTGVTFPA
jgi:uncharacterized protein